MIRRCLYFLLTFFFSIALNAQETSRNPAAAFFPLALVLDAVEFAETPNMGWQPDWPLDLPPDAFRVRNGDVSRITIETEGFTYSRQFGLDGQIEEFPVMLNSRMAQVKISYRDSPEENNHPGENNHQRIISEIQIFLDDDPWVLEILEYGYSLPILTNHLPLTTNHSQLTTNHSHPSLIRVSHSGTWYFISLLRGGNRITETWYNEDGEAVGAYVCYLIPVGNDLRIRSVRNYFTALESWEYEYNSRGLVSAISGSAGYFNALYNGDDYPRYWEYRPSDGDGGSTVGGPGGYSFQWDKQDMLLRLTGESYYRESVHTEHRYEYTFDERGNWTERREIRMISNMGLLIPSPGTTVMRYLENE